MSDGPAVRVFAPIGPGLAAPAPVAPRRKCLHAYVLAAQGVSHPDIAAELRIRPSYAGAYVAAGRIAAARLARRAA